MAAQPLPAIFAIIPSSNHSIIKSAHHQISTSSNQHIILIFAAQ
jgi:hypothetical protein